MVLCLGIIAAGSRGFTANAGTMEVSGLQADADAMSALTESADSSKKELPSKLDLRTKELTGKVKGFNNNDSLSWAYSMLGQIENDYITDDPDLDLSEKYFSDTYNAEIDESVCTDSMAINVNPPYLGTASGLLSNWMGPVSEDQNEAVFHLKDLISIRRVNVGDQSEYDGYSFQDFDKEQMKEILNSGHTLYAETNSSCICMNEYTGTYQPTTLAMRTVKYNGSSVSVIPYTSVMIVGYDTQIQFRDI